ncbi:MAG: M20 aminoacylase family protein [Rhizobiaceae bacterium]
MPIINRMAELHDEITAWRREFHTMPELLYDVHKTAARVSELLREFGCDDVVEGIGRTGVVGIVEGNGQDGPVIGLRADMDALPIEETSGKPWSSKEKGKMHACGHDGHTAMLLGAAKYLAESRNFSGKVALIFQPAEEGGAGGRAMVDDGLMERFNISEVYGMHNLPGLPVGQFGGRSGAITASTDEFNIVISGKGGHAAFPHMGNDPIVAAGQCITAIQTIVSRNTDPLDSLVVSVTQIHAGSSHNIIPGSVRMNGTIRCFSKETREYAARRLEEIVRGTSEAHGVEADTEILTGYPVTINHDSQTDSSLKVAVEIAGEQNVDANMAPMLGGEDFSFMLESRPGSFIFMGNGDTPGLHNSSYDFNDEAIPHGCSYWVRLVETRLPT